MGHAEQDEVSRKPHAQADERVVEGREQADKRQYLKREDHLLDVVGVGKDDAGRPVDAFGKQVEDNQAGKKHEGKLGFRITAVTPAGLEHLAEDEGVDRKHEERIEERPEQTEGGTPVTAQHFTLGRGMNQAAVAPEAGHHFDWGGREVTHQAKISASVKVLPCASLAERMGWIPFGHSIRSVVSFQRMHRSWARA